MKYLDFRHHFKEFPVFSTNDIYKADPSFDRRRLVEWQDNQHLLKLANGFYTFKEQKLNEQFLFFTSNRMYKPSYISLESAFGYYNFIPEGVFTVTAVTTGKTQEFQTQNGVFKYRKMKEEFFFGYRLIPYNNVQIKMALPEKALLDFFYFNRNINKDEEFEHLRFNKIVVRKNISLKRLNMYARQFHSERLNNQVKQFDQYLHYA